MEIVSNQVLDEIDVYIIITYNVKQNKCQGFGFRYISNYFEVGVMETFH